jgi:hypothetical protein
MLYLPTYIEVWFHLLSNNILLPSTSYLDNLVALRISKGDLRYFAGPQAHSSRTTPPTEGYLVDGKQARLVLG